MAFTQLESGGANFDSTTRDETPLNEKIGLCLGSQNPNKTFTALNEVFSDFDFKASVVSSTNDTGSVVDLTAKGITFPADTIRTLGVHYFAQTDNDCWEMEFEQDVLGGTTPILLGTARITRCRGRLNTANVDYGNVELHCTLSGGTVTVVAASSSSGISLANLTNGAGALTFPTGRLAAVTGAHFAEDAGTINDVRGVQVRTINAAAGTAVLEVFTINGTEAIGAGSQPTGVCNLDVSMKVLPPVNCFFSMSTNNVQLHVLGITDEGVKHTALVKIGKARPSLFVEGAED